jgi:translation initiation factor IF-2
MRERGAQQQRAQPPAAPTGPVTVESGVTVKDLSQALGVSMPQIIKVLMGLGQMRTATQSLSDDEVELIASEVGREVTIRHAADGSSSRRRSRTARTTCARARPW